MMSFDGNMNSHWRKFTFQDQIAFANLSGDNNPLHVDRVAARRYIFGAPVAHGIHAVLWALDKWLEGRAGPIKLRALKAYLLRPIIVEEEVQFSVVSEHLNHVVVELLSGGSESVRIEFDWEALGQQSVDQVETGFPKQHPPRMLKQGELASTSGTLDLRLDIGEAAALFPQVIGRMPAPQIAVLLATSRLVGVECPGFHSLYSELDLSTSDSAPCARMNYGVVKFDKRFGEVLIKIEAAGMRGTIKAFVRPTPQHQASYIAVKQSVNRHEFAGQRALVIGGSRGLGEVIGKLLCAGGAEIKITYYQGNEDAQRVIDEIRLENGIADCFYFDVLNPRRDDLDRYVESWKPTHLYYFATPFIFSSVKGIFAPNLFAKFSDYYVSGFVSVVNRLRRLGVKNVFYPSTIAIDELPLGMAEYVAAKTAGEMLCDVLAKTHREMIFYKPRFPRMATDQTATFVPVVNLDPVPLMLDALRSFRNLTTPMDNG